MTVLDELIHRADLDDLVRHVERTVAARDWAHLVETRDAARAAVSTGRQLWPIATLANVRLALRAPAEHAVRALDDGARTFMPGPVSEILACAHDWRDLAPHLPHGHDRSLVAYERALRGDPDVTGNEPAVLEIPVVPAEWEPRYATAVYDDDGAHDEPPASAVGDTMAVGDTPTVDAIDAAGVGRPGSIDTDNAVTDAFRQLVEPWTASSNGTARIAFVEGGVRDALSALDVTSARCVRLDAKQTLAWLAWAGASGGAHGRRRGAATGRFGAWWLLAAIAGMDIDGWPPNTARFGEVLSSMECWWWDGGNDTGGWRLRLVVRDVDEGTSCAMEALDHL